MLCKLFAVMFAAMVAIVMNQQIFPPDELLNHMVGKWNITRKFAKREATNSAEAAWILNGHWLQITMKDTSVPPRYEAHVLITYVLADKRYSCHWIDTYGGAVPETLGIGIREQNSLVFTFTEKDGALRNTFTWHPESKSWTDKIEQTDEKGQWTLFCTDVYRPTD